VVDRYKKVVDKETIEVREEEKGWGLKGRGRGRDFE
jgi:hypothetical protein